MLPFTTQTKVGPGDKSKAYVIRQNTCLRFLLFTLVGLCLMLMVLASTMYDVHVERRSKAWQSGVHRREERSLRLQVGRLGMRLQQHMHDDVRDMSILREYRARMYRAVGEYQNTVRSTVEEATSRNATLTKTLAKLELELDEQLEMAMRKLWSDVNEEGKRAGEKLHNLTTEIIDGMRLEQHEEEDFEEQYGEGAEYHEDAEEGFKEGDDYSEDIKDREGDEEDEDYEEVRMRFALDRLLTRLKAMPNITLSADELTDWDTAYNAALDSMGDESKEADLEAIQAKLVARMTSKGVSVKAGRVHAAEGAQDDGSDGGEGGDDKDEYVPSVFDQFETALEAAKVMPKKPELFLKFGEWQAGTLPTPQLIQFVEELYDQNVLESGLFEDWDDR
mmetsp:Transcript_26062/g.66195  ORF Transcript_26062/g.66195 Transcript_26062/m.66195 type:complete len:391 (+) Transcript_26062:187-1359(+)